ncbi:hypothetical protein [Shewanella sp. 10N.286.54.B9]|uniref:hypothetical protein n=1 Tax=Shewanella sp. 10N.286.54.B9 TaxID=3229719 RepID=UPI003553B2BC
MNINFNYGGKQYLNFDIDSEEWQALDITDADKLAIIQQAKADEQLRLRSDAYKNEADPLHIEWQFEVETQNPDADTYKQKWIEKVQQIKLRYPLVELS